MEERTPPTPPPPLTSRPGASPHRTSGAGHALDATIGAQVPLPFDDESDQPIGFTLTARARRTVAPDALPALRVVPGDRTGPEPMPGDLAQPTGSAGAGVATRETRGAGSDAPELEDDPSDTRPARARALRRAGVDADLIAGQLGVDELLVRAWITGVVAPAHPSKAATTLVPILHPDPEREAAAALRARTAACDLARRRLAERPQLAAGLGLLAGVAELAGDAVTVTTRDPRVAGVAVRWLVEALEIDPVDVRLVLRVGPRAAADLARHRWGQAVGIAPDRVRTTRARAAAGDDEVEAVLRVVDRHLAATLAGWCDALLEGATTAAGGF